MLQRSYLPCSLFVFALALCLGCGNRVEDINQAFTEPSDVRISFDSIKMTFTDSALRRIDLIAPSMYRVLDPKNTKAEDHYDQGLVLHFYDINGRLQATLSAKNARQIPDDNLVILQDSVVYFTPKRDTFRTEVVFWNQKEKRIYNNNPFQYSSPTQHVMGYQLDADEQFEHFTYKKMSGKLSGELIQLD